MRYPVSDPKLAICVWLSSALLLLTYVGLRFGLNSPPSATGDEPSYDSIGWQLAQGHGFREDYSDPVFRRPYDEAAVDDPALMTLPEIPAGTITYRPPLFPMLIAMTDLLFGPQFWAVRILNILAISACGAMAFHFAARQTHAMAGVLALLIFLVDVRVRLYARAILTEAPAMLLTTLMTILILQVMRRCRWQDGILLGLICGLAALNRTALLLWMPGIFCGILLLAWCQPKRGCAVLPSAAGTADSSAAGTADSPAAGTADSTAADTGESTAAGMGDVRQSEDRRQRLVRLMPPLLTAVSVTLLVYAPWGIRNCLVLDRFLPMGTQGMMELSAAFSDHAVERQGVWFILDERGFFDGITTERMTRLERELARADHSRRVARQWIADNPAQALRLIPLKVFHEYRPHSVTESVIAALAVLGAMTTWRQLPTQVFLLLHAVNALIIGVTWSVEGRFVVPLLFSIHVLAAGGLYWLMQKFRVMPRAARMWCATL